MEKLTFRLRGVKKGVTQTLLDNARTGNTRISHVATDKTGRQCFVRLNDRAEYHLIGEVPVQQAPRFRSLMREPIVSAVANVVGGGWSIREPGLLGKEVARYGSNSDIEQHHAQGVMQGDYEVVHLNVGLEITIEAGLPPVHNDPNL